MAELFKVNAPVRKPLFEGVQGENEARSIQFDVTPWVEELGDGAVTATAKRSQDSQPYPVTVTKDGNTVTWKPTSTDTAYAGVGSFQLEYTVDSVLAKTCIWSTMVAPSLDPAGDPPDPYDNWLAEMREIAADAIQAAQDADESADDAQAEVYEAEAWAKGTKNGTPVSSSDAQYQNNAKYWAELNAGDHAELVDIRIGADGTTYANAGDAVRGQISGLNSATVKYPIKYTEVEFTSNVGLVNRNDLSIFSLGDGYAGRYTSIPVTAGDVYFVSGRSVNDNFPCCFGVIENGTTAYIPLFLRGTATYTDAEVVIPDNIVTMYVNGDTSYPIGIKKKGRYSQAEFEEVLFKEEAIGDKVKAYYNSSSLYFKKKSLLNSKDLIVEMGQSPIGNNLFTFLNVYNQPNTGEMTNDFTPVSGADVLSASQTDWIAPYQVKAINNANGDHPTSVYFTGGNHRSNNGSSGGGKTATQTALKILFDGIVPTNGQVYNCDTIDVFVTNEVNGYNTSKDDGTGRNILKENIHFHITSEKIEVELDMIPLEEILVERNYGLQVYYSDAEVCFMGGDYRKPFTVSDGRNANNKTTRDVVVEDAFQIKSGIYMTDMGDYRFNETNYGYFTSGSKVYSNIIRDNTINFEDDEIYSYKGYYEFN